MFAQFGLEGMAIKLGFQIRANDGDDQTRLNIPPLLHFN